MFQRYFILSLIIKTQELVILVFEKIMVIYILVDHTEVV